MSSRFTILSTLVLALGAAHCGGVVIAADGDAAVASDSPVTPDTDAAITPVTPSPSCAEVRASCGPEPQRFVRGHAEGLTGLDGARARFAMRYLPTPSGGLNRQHGVVSAWGRVEAGAFEACVCLPRGGNEYPQLAAVVFAPGSTGELGRDVVRAVFSQRYATLGDENLAHALGEVPTAHQIEAALAGMVDRAVTLTVRGIDPAVGSARIYGGLVADERVVAAEVAATAITEAGARFDWIMPGRAWPGERLALVVDRNGNRRCDDGDLGAMLRLDGRPEVTVGPLASGAALESVCRALGLDAPRE